MLRNHIPASIYDKLQVEEWDLAIYETGIDLDALKSTIVNMIAIDDKSLRRVAAFLLFARYIKNFLGDACGLVTEEAIGRISCPETRRWVATEAIKMQEYRRIIDTFEPIHTGAIEEVVCNFGQALSEPGRRIELPGRSDIGFDPRMLAHLCTEETLPFVERALNTIAHDIRHPESVPEFGFLRELFIDKIRDIMNDPSINNIQESISKMDGEVSVSDLTSTVISQAMNKDRSGDIGGLINIIYLAFDTAFKAFKSEHMNRDLIIKSVMVSLAPLIKTIAETSVRDNIIYSYYRRMLCMDSVLSIRKEEWLRINDELVEGSPIYNRFFRLCRDKVEILIGCVRTFSIISEEDRFD